MDRNFSTAYTNCLQPTACTDHTATPSERAKNAIINENCPVKVQFRFFSNSEIRISQSPVAKYLVIEGSKVQSKSTIEEPIRMRVEKFEKACSVHVRTRFTYSNCIFLTKKLMKKVWLYYTDYVTWRHVSKINTFNGIIFREPEARKMHLSKMCRRSF